MNENLRLKTLTVVTLFAGSCALWGQPRYRAVEIPTLGGVGTIAQGINNAGQIVGQSAAPGNTGQHAFMYKRGTLYDLCPGYTGVAWAVNNSGCSAGLLWLDQRTTRAVRFSQENATELGTLGGRSSAAYGINNSGDIVGISSLAGDTISRAFFYHSGRMVDLGTLGGRHSLAYAINDGGDIAGQADLPDGGSHVFLYRKGQMEDLGFPGVPYAMNNRRQIVGVGYLPQTPGRSSGFLYHSGTLLDLGSLGAEGTVAYGINNSGTVVGSASTQPGVLHAFVFVDGQMYDLNELLVNEISGTLIGASGINEGGEIIAVAAVQGVIGWSYLLTPARLSSLAISGPNSLNENSTAQYVATALMSDGTSQTVSPTWSEDSAATSISTDGMLSAAEVASDTPVTLTASYTTGGATWSAQKTVTVVNVVVVPSYSLTASGTHGTVTKSPDLTNYPAGSVVSLTAVPDAGYQFSLWSGDRSSVANPLSVTVNGNMTLVAHFVEARGETNVIFADDFDDDSIDTNKWTLSGNTVAESGQTMQVLTTVTDQGGLLTSVPVAISPSGDITITRRVKVHYANDNYVGDICMRFGGVPWAAVYYANASYSGPDYMARYGTYIGRNTDVPAGAHYNVIQTGHQSDMSPAYPIVWDTWFNEKVIYSPSSGVLQYFVNEQSISNYFIGIMPATNNQTLQIGFRAWGWYIGHQQVFDDLVVTQTSAAPTLKREE